MTQHSAKKSSNAVKKKTVAGPTFTYSNTTQPGLSRKYSFCTFNPTSKPLTEDAATYLKAQMLGEGAFGKVTKMISPDGRAVAVKEFSPEKIYYPPDWTLEMISSFINHAIENMNIEAQCNAAYYGKGAYYRINAPIKATKVYGEWRLESYPRVYIVMECVEAPNLKNFPIDSLKTYLEVFIAALEELKIMHTKFMHLDIKSDNVLILKDENNNFSARYCDFSLSKFSENDPLILKDINLTFKPPEYKNKSSILPRPGHDIFGTGTMFKLKLAEYCQQALKRDSNFKLPKKFEEAINNILMRMTHIAPGVRYTVDQAIEEVIKCYYIYLFSTELNALEKAFPDTTAVNKWWYCHRILGKLEKSGSISDFSQFSVAYQRLNSPSWNMGTHNSASKLIASLEEQKITISDALNEAKKKHRLAILNHLLLHNEETVSNLFIEHYRKNFLDGINIFIKGDNKLLNKKYYQDLLDRLFLSALVTLEANFVNSDEAIGRWCNYAIFHQYWCEERLSQGLLKYDVDSLDLLKDFRPELGVNQIVKNADSASKLAVFLQLLNDDNRIFLLKELSKKNKTYFADIISTEKDYQIVNNLLPSAAHQKTFRILWLESKQSKFVDQLESKNRIDALDKWCHCEHLTYVLKNTETDIADMPTVFKQFALPVWPKTMPGVTSLKEVVVTNAANLVALLKRTPTLIKMKLLSHLGVNHLRSMIKSRQDLLAILKEISAQDLMSFFKLLGNEYLNKHYHIETFSPVELQEYISVLDTGLGAAQTNIILKAFANNIIDKQIKDKVSTFEKALLHVDAVYKPGSQVAYKRMVLAFNDVYYDKRKSEGWGCTLFGGFSKSYKLTVSQKLAENKKLSDAEEKASHQGRLGLIGRRLG